MQEDEDNNRFAYVPIDDVSRLAETKEWKIKSMNSWIKWSASFSVIGWTISDAGSQYRWGQVGRGIQPSFTPSPNPHTLAHTRYTVTMGASFSQFSIQSPWWYDGPTDQRTKPLTELRVRNYKHWRLSQWMRIYGWNCAWIRFSLWNEFWMNEYL